MKAREVILAHGPADGGWVGASSDILDTLFSPTSRPVSPGSPESPG